MGWIYIYYPISRKQHCFSNQWEYIFISQRGDLSVQPDILHSQYIT